MTRPTSTHRPGAISAFFVYKAGLFAACFWGWLGYLAVRGGTPTGWHLIAAAGAVTTTLVGVVLGARFALQRSAARRHEELMETLVEISWHSFTSGAEPRAAEPRVGEPRVGEPRIGEPRIGEPRTHGEPRDGDAEVIRLTQDLRQRPRR